MRRVLRALSTLLANLARVVLLAALRNWRRNLLTTSPALASVALLLGTAGLFGIGWRAMQSVIQEEARAASVLHVYIADGVSTDSVSALEDRLRADRRVESVRYISPAEALARARSRPGLSLLLEGDSGQSFPGEIEVTVASVESVSPIAEAVRDDPAVDPAFPTSYDGDAYRRLTALMRYAEMAAGGVLALLLGVALIVSGNAIRASLLARRDEVAIMWLVGSPGWALRAPFVVEGALTGTLAGVVAGGLLAAAIAAAARAQPVVVAQFLPGVTTSFGLGLAGAIVLLGAGVGMGSTVAGLRGLQR